jgi:putative SOS response-associated peptidase YedK
MCGRIRSTYIADKLAEKLRAELRATLAPSNNVAPTQDVLALVRTERGLAIDKFRWGLIPSWASDPKIGNKTFNARAETITEKPSFRAAFRARRCAILVDAWYEWATIDGKKVPHAFSVEGQEVVALAGLWDTWKERASVGEAGGASPRAIQSCTIITTEANATTKAFHHRMPVVLDPAALEKWLDPKATEDELLKLLVPYGGGIGVARTEL